MKRTRLAIALLIVLILFAASASQSSTVYQEIYNDTTNNWYGWHVDITHGTLDLVGLYPSVSEIYSDNSKGPAWTINIISDTCFEAWTVGP
jgi:hypothetical protein